MLADRLRGGRDVDGRDGAVPLDLLAERQPHLLVSRADRDRSGSALATSSRVVFEPTSMTPIRISTHRRSAIGRRAKRSGDGPVTDLDATVQRARASETRRRARRISVCWPERGRSSFFGSHAVPDVRSRRARTRPRCRATAPRTWTTSSAWSAGVLDRGHDLDAVVEVARHQVGAAHEADAAVGGVEDEEPAVLEKAADHAAHADVLAQLRHAGPQASRRRARGGRSSRPPRTRRRARRSPAGASGRSP